VVVCAGFAARTVRQPSFQDEIGMKSCLIVTESAVLRKVATRIFANLRFETSDAEDGQAALDHCLQSAPDAIFLDCHLPGMSSMDFLAAFRGATNGNKPVILYCATENDPKELALALTLGADDYVLKPFDREAVRSKLATAGIA
jgi:two-component system chemotaxis response regulator CheY